MSPILVLGAGPAGLAAAEAASRTGQAVLLLDENPEPGGQIWRGGERQWKDRRAQKLWQTLLARPSVRMEFGTRVLADAGGGLLLLACEGVPRVQAWERVIVCSGARELLLPFPGWTLPGVTGAGGLQALVKGGMPVEGKRVVVAGTGPLLLAVAATVDASGGIVAAIVEHRDTRALARFAGRLALGHSGKLAQAAALYAGLLGVPYLRAADVVRAEGVGQVRAVVVRQKGQETEIACDFLACGYGLVPALEVAGLFGCARQDGRITVDAAQATSVGGVWAAGESTGIGGVDKALSEGCIAGLAAIGLSPSRAELAARAQAHAFANLLAQTFIAPAVMRETCTPATIVCRCEDVSAAELEPHASWRSAKLQTRVGMGPCQGRVCGAACGFLYGWDEPGARPPVFPVSAAVLAAACVTAEAAQVQA